MTNIKKILFILTFMLVTITSTTFAESKSVFPSASGAVTIANRFGHTSLITFDGRYFKTGDQVHVYSNSDATNRIGISFPSELPIEPFNLYLDNVVVEIPQLGQNSGSLYVTLTDSYGNPESDPVKVDYAQEITITNNVDISDTATVTGLLDKDIVKLYGSDGTSSLGTGTASKDGDLVVNISKQLPEPPLEGLFFIYATIKSSGGSESAKAAIAYNRSVTSVAPVGSIAVADKSADILVTNNLTATDTITFLNLKAKDIATVYAPDKVGSPNTFLFTTDSKIIYATTKANVIGTATLSTVLGTATASKDGNLVIKLTKQLSEDTKNIYVSVKHYNSFESPVTLVQYFRAGQAPTIDNSGLSSTIPPTAYDMVTTANAVFVSGVHSNDIVTVYDSGTHNLIGTATVANGNNYVVVNFISINHSIYVKNKEVGKLISTASSLISIPQ